MMSTDNTQLLRIYLRRLVKSLVPQELGSDYTETVFHELLSLVESKNHDNWYEVDPVLSAIKSRLMSSGGPEIWQIFQEAAQYLSRFKNSESIARYLVFLENMTGGIEDTPRPRNPTVERITNQFVRENIDADGRSVSGSFFGGDSFENINFDRFSDRRSIYSAAQHRNDSRDYTLEEVAIPYFENHIHQDDILKYISFTLVGTTSNLFPLNNGEIELPDNLSNSESGLLHIVFECGLIYQFLVSLIENFKSNKSSSPTKNAIMSYIYEELTNYMKMVNILSNKQTFSLRSLFADLLDELVKLRFLYFISKRVGNEPGNKLLSLVYRYQNFGDHTVSESSSNLLKYSLEPFLKCLASWSVDGELIDKSNEFFVSRSDSSSKDIDVRFEEDKVPSFFSKELGFQIYLIGKTNIFLKKYCKESKWCNLFSQKLNIIFNRVRLNKIALFNDNEFQKSINDHYSEIINYFNYVIYTKFNFMSILQSLKEFLFMGKGDFIQALVTNGIELLNEPSNSLSGHQLTKLLQSAVFGTTVRYHLVFSDEHDLLKNLDARLLEIGHGNVGWDVFTLDYQIQSPISLILNDELNQFKKDYLKIFNYLWKLRRLETLFIDEWRKEKNQRWRQSTSFGRSLFKKINRIRLVQNFLRDFFRNIEKFILEEIIETEYKELCDQLRPKAKKLRVPVVKTGNDFKVARGILSPSDHYLDEMNKFRLTFERKEHGYEEHSIDDLKNIHTHYLNSITKHKLFNGSSAGSKGTVSKKYYINQVNSLINLVFKFVITVKEFNMLVDEFEGHSRFGEEYSESANISGRFSTIYNNLLKLFDDFNYELKIFINDLSNDDDLKMRYLGISLNQ